MQIPIDAMAIIPQMVKGASDAELKYMLHAINDELFKREQEEPKLPEMNDDEYNLLEYAGGNTIRIKPVKAYRDRTRLSLKECLMAFDKKHREHLNGK